MTWYVQTFKFFHLLDVTVLKTDNTVSLVAKTELGKSTIPKCKHINLPHVTPSGVC